MIATKTTTKTTTKTSSTTTTMIYVSMFAVFVLVPFSQAEIGHFWHVTDIHLDNNYTTDGDPSRMCWSFTKSVKEAEAPTDFGNYSCDAPITLVHSAINAMRDIFPNPDFIVWTGDDTVHVNDSFFSTEIVLGVIQQVTDVIMEVFPDTLVLPVLGNHDLYPQNQAPVGPSELQSRVAKMWKKWLDPFGAFASFEKDGRYTADIPNTNISFVALNTLLWYIPNLITANDPTASDPAGQFEWASWAIRNLSDNGRKVYVMGHIPPGSFERYFDEREGFHWYQDRYNTKYIEMVNQEGSRISGQFFGHHHTDSFRVFLNETESAQEPVSYLLIAPAVSPMKSTLSETAGANNPGIRLVTYDTATGEVLEVSQFYLDLEKANQELVDNWQLEYNMTQLLDLKDISPQSLHEAFLRLKSDSTLFANYYPVSTVQWENVTACSDSCRSAILCSMTAIDYSKYYSCNAVPEFCTNQASQLQECDSPPFD